MKADGVKIHLGGALLLGIVSGLLLALSFPPTGWWPLAWFALLPLLLAIRLASGSGAALASWCTGFLFFGMMLYWLALFGISVWFLASLLLSLVILAFGLAVRWTGRLRPASRTIGAVLIWGALEQARGLGPFGFTWGWLGYSQTSGSFILPLARLFGTIGISVVIVLANAALAEFIVNIIRREKPLLSFLRTMVLLAVIPLTIFGARAWIARQPPLSGPRVNVAVIQGSAHGPLTTDDVNRVMTSEEIAETLRIYRSLTAEVAAARPALVVWPESVLPQAPDIHAPTAEAVAAAARVSSAWLLAGGPYQDQNNQVFNSAYLFAPTGHLVARYDKVHLVPFGEYVPARERLPFIHHYNVREMDFSAGAVHRVLQAGAIALGPVICFESIFPHISYQLVQDGAQLLVVITNDAWFGHTAAAEQHLQIARLRAVETNRWVIRGASTGISALVSPEGEIITSAELYERAALVHQITLAAEDEGFSGLGPLFGWLVFLLGVAYLIAPAAAPKQLRRSRKKAGAPAAVKRSSPSSRRDK